MRLAERLLGDVAVLGEVLPVLHDDDVRVDAEDLLLERLLEAGGHRQHDDEREHADGHADDRDDRERREDVEQQAEEEDEQQRLDEAGADDLHVAVREEDGGEREQQEGAEDERHERYRRSLAAPVEVAPGDERLVTITQRSHARVLTHPLS